jgi:sulfur-oxidizing protein SoxX
MTPIEKESLSMNALRVWCSLVMLATVMLQGCQPESAGLALPEGDAEAGKQVFVDLHCNGCHSIGDVEYAESDVPVMYMGKRTTGKIHVVLAGDKSGHRTQGELVTSVINPGHKISTSYSRHLATTKSPMKTYNETMTVQNLIDVVAFFQSEFE